MSGAFSGCSEGLSPNCCGVDTVLASEEAVHCPLSILDAAGIKTRLLFQHH